MRVDEHLAGDSLGEDQEGDERVSGFDRGIDDGAAEGVVAVLLGCGDQREEGGPVPLATASLRRPLP